MNFSFSKKLRLLAPSQFSYVFKRPFKIGDKYISILGRKNLLLYPRLGISISRKKIKKSHDRNRLKRLIRITFRMSQSKLNYLDYVVIVNHSTIVICNNKLLIKILEGLWTRFYQILPRS
ncbi:ribonuclease P protein component [Buchnera aphidicola (Hormaphis cornu)]|nr:ribonuclease P protein component [Buchnera aphidicola (Hormaphis cornu)]